MAQLRPAVLETPHRQEKGYLTKEKTAGQDQEEFPSQAAFAQVLATLLLLIANVFILRVITKYVLQSSPQGAGASTTCSTSEVCVVQTAQLTLVGGSAG